MPFEISWTKRASRLPDEVKRVILERMASLQPYFPELESHIRIGRTRFFEGLVFQSCNGKVRLSLEVKERKDGTWRYPTYLTIAHELMHLVQFNSDEIPEGERECDIFVLERLPPEFIDESPTYLYVPPNARTIWTENDAALAHDIAGSAVKMFRSGDDSYASFWEDEFERRYATHDPDS